MTGLPWFKCYPRDFNDGLMGLTMEERGAYITILNAIYARGKPVEDDPSYWRAMLQCSGKAWSKVRAALIVKRKLFEVTVDGVPCLMNRRAAEEIEENLETRRKLSERGARGGAKPRVKDKENNDVTEAAAKPVLSDTEAETEQKRDREAIASLVHSFACALERVAKAHVAKRVAEDFRAFWAVYPRRVAKDAAEKSFGKAWRKVGTENPLAVILAGIERALPGWDDPQFIPHPATWLNQGRWADEEPPPPKVTPLRSNHDRPDPLTAKRDNLDRGFRAAESGADLLAARRAM